MKSKNIVIGILVLVIIGALAYLLLNKSNKATVVVEQIDTEEVTPVESDNGIGDSVVPIEAASEMEREGKTVIGASTGGKEITAYHFGSGKTEILLVGGTHGSYSPNTSALAKEVISYYSIEANAKKIPDNVLLTVIPELNPDGLAMTGTEGRFNANNVDLNRNFDCEWSPTGVWREQKVSGGSGVFSEPEAQALRDYVETYDPNAAIVLFSAEGKVYPSACEKVPSKASVELAATFASAAGYPVEAEFNAYAITGDMVNWMAKLGIPSISVLLSDHKNTEWAKNKAGIEAVLKSYAE